MRLVQAHERFRSAAWLAAVELSVDINQMQFEVESKEFLCVNFRLQSADSERRFGVGVIDLRTGAVLAAFSLVCVTEGFPAEVLVAALAFFAVHTVLKSGRGAPVALAAGLVLLPAAAWAMDDFPGTTISGTSGSIAGSNVGATGGTGTQTGEPTSAANGTLNTIWYSWTAPATGTVIFQTCSSTSTNFDTVLAGFTGAAVNALTLLQRNDDTVGCLITSGSALGSRVSFAATSGVTYSIQVDGYTTATGSFLLQWDLSVPVAAFAITKTASVSSVSAPGTITYTIRVENTGNATLTGLTISDALTQVGSPRTLASGPTYSSGDTDGDGRIDTNETWIYTATYSVTQSDIDNGGTFSNTATFDTTQTAPSTSAAATTTVTQSPSFTIVKTQNAGPSPVTAAGDILGWTIAVDNTGNLTLNGLSISDALTLGGSPRTLFAGPTYSSGDTDSDGQIDTTEVWNYSATYQVTQADLDGTGSFSNTATFDTAQTAPAVTSAAAVTAVTRAPALTITKTADAAALLGNVVAGQTITYTYVVTNTGKVTVNNVSVSDVHNGSDPDPVPGGEALIDVAPLGDSTDATAGNGVWSVLRPGDSVTLTATYVVTQTDVDNLQ